MTFAWCAQIGPVLRRLIPIGLGVKTTKLRRPCHNSMSVRLKRWGSLSLTPTYHAANQLSHNV